MRVSQFRKSFAVLGSVACGVVFAQSVPPALPSGLDPAQIQKQRETLELQRLQRPAPDTAPKLSAPPTVKVATPTSTATFLLRRVDTGPSRLLSPDELASAIEPQLNRPTTFADVQALVQRINTLYLEHGHLTARALVPAQKIEAGVLKVQLVEATLARIDLPAQTRLSGDFVRGVIATVPGALIDVPRISEHLERLHRGTDARLALNFVPADGDAVGQSVIEVQIDEPAKWFGRLSLSNEGNVAVGREQVSFSGGINNVLGYADRLSLLGIYSSGSSSANLQFSAGTGPNGVRGNLGLSLGRTRTVSGPTNDLIVDGGSQGITAGLSRPLWTGGPWAIDGALTLGDSRSDTQIAGERFSDVRLLSTAGALTFSRVSDSSSLSGTLSVSVFNIDAARLASRSATLTQLSLASVHTLDAFAPRWSIQSRAQLQSSSAMNSPGTLQMQLGGPGSVRGFAAPTIGGDAGVQLSLELHRQFGTSEGERSSANAPSTDAFVFADTGGVKTEGKSADNLTSLGFGLNWRRGIWNVSATAAFPQHSSVPASRGSQFYLRLSVDLDPWMARLDAQRSPPSP